MGRRHGNTPPVPKTTWAISLQVDEMVSKAKSRHDTIDDFIKKVFEQWLNGKKQSRLWKKRIQNNLK